MSPQSDLENVLVAVGDGLQVQGIPCRDYRISFMDLSRDLEDLRALESVVSKIIGRQLEPPSAPCRRRL